MIPLSPCVPPAPARRPGRRGRAGAIALLVGLVAGAAGLAGSAAASGAAGGGPTTSDARFAGGDSIPPVTARTAPALARDRFARGIRADRLSHLSLALAIGVGVGLPAREPAAGAGAAVTLAAAKELLDDRFDRGDLVAGAAGAGLAWLMVTAITR